MTKPYRAGLSPVNKREVYEVDEVRRMLKACPETTTGIRDRFAVMLLWSTGLRTSELLSLRPTDYNEENVMAGARKIVVPGGQRQRLQERFEDWMKHRKAIAKRRSPLLCNLTGGALDSSYVRHMLASLSEQAELGKRLNVQGFRNTFAAAMHYGGVPLEIIRRQLGHSDIEYTAGYVAVVAPVGQHEAMGIFSLE